MGSRVFRELAPTKLLFRCAVPAAVTSVFGALYSIADGFVFARPFVELVAPGASPQAIGYAVDYLSVHSALAPLVLIYFATDNYLRVCGKQTVSMAVNIVTQILNICATFVAVVLLEQGVMAAALASCGSIALGSIATLLMFRGRRLDVYYTKGRIAAARFLRIVANGASEFFSSIAMSVMSVVFNLFVLRYGGTTAVAVFAIVMYVDEVVGMLNFGISDSMQPAISHCYGAGLIDRTKALFRRVAAASAITSAVAFALMLVAGFGTLVFPIASLFLLTRVWGLNGVWLTAPVSALASAVLALALAATMKRGCSAEARIR